MGVPGINKLFTHSFKRKQRHETFDEKMNEFLYSEYEKNPVRTYLTKGGEKKEV